MDHDNSNDGLDDADASDSAIGVDLGDVDNGGVDDVGGVDTNGGAEANCSDGDSKSG